MKWVNTFIRNVEKWPNVLKTLKYVQPFFNIMNQRVGIHTNKTVKVPEIPKQKHLIYIFNKVSLWQIICIAQVTKSTRMKSFTGTPSQIQFLLNYIQFSINFIFLFVLSQQIFPRQIDLLNELFLQQVFYFYLYTRYHHYLHKHLGQWHKSVKYIQSLS